MGKEGIFCVKIDGVSSPGLDSIGINNRSTGAPKPYALLDNSVGPNGVMELGQSSQSERGERAQYYSKLQADMNQVDQMDSQSLTSSANGVNAADGSNKSSDSVWTIEDISENLAFAYPGAKQNFDKLSPDQKAKYTKLINNYMASLRPQPQGKGQIPFSLSNILVSDDGKNLLLQKDSKGGILLDTLLTLSTQKLANGLDRATLIDELANAISIPEMIHQGARGACVVTSIEYTLAKRNPAEFARLVTGLTGEKGSVVMANGRTLKRNDSGLAKDNSGRSNIDRIFQSSLQDYANGDLYGYDNTIDNDTSILTGYLDRGAGLSARDGAKGAGAVLGKAYEANGYVDSPAERASFTKKVQKALRQGDPVFVGMRFGGTGHELALTEISGGQVKLWNPWGANEDGRVKGPPRKLNSAEGSGHITMTTRDFFSSLSSFNVPK